MKPDVVSFSCAIAALKELQGKDSSKCKEN